MGQTQLINELVISNNLRARVIELEATIEQLMDEAEANDPDTTASQGSDIETIEAIESDNEVEEVLTATNKGGG
eukprot:4297407-Heterocapsa_arctica.AAC.1